MANNSGAGRIVTIVIGSMTALFCMAGCVYMFKVLLSPWWIPVSITTVIAVALALPMRSLWRWLTKSDNIALNLICHLVFTLPFLLCAGLSVNYATSGKNPVKEEVIVGRVYKETRYKTKRVSRRVYTRGAPYSVYCLELCLPKGHTRNIEVPKKIYDRVSKGDTVGIDVSKGSLGLTVFDGGHIHVSESKTKESKKESAREKKRRIYREHMEKVLNRRYNH